MTFFLMKLSMNAKTMRAQKFYKMKHDFKGH